MMKNEPLGLPKGSVRAMITIGVIISAVIAIFIRSDATERLLSLATLVIGYYFGNRSDFNIGGGGSGAA